MAALVLSCLLLPWIAGCGSGATDPGVEETPPPRPLQWRPIQRLPASELLHAVDASDAVAIAVGEGGVVLVRQGGGAWRAVERPVESALREVVLLSEKTALAVADGALLRSEDAGETWEVTFTSDSALRDLAARGEAAAAVGNDAILLSRDGGRTWSAPSGTVPATAYLQVDFLSDSVLMAAGLNGNLFRSQDGGQNWTQVAVAELPETPTDLAFFDRDFGMATFASPAEVWWTSDGGDTWSQAVGLGQNRITDVERVSAKIAFVVLDSGQIHRTDDAGKTWSFVSLAPNQLTPFDLQSLAVVDGTWSVVGSRGFVARSEDDGATWKVDSVGRVGNFLSIACFDAGTAVAAFQPVLDPGETALRTTDGGATWQAVDPRIDRPQIAVAGAGVGLLVARQEVSRSLDGGASWTPIPPPVDDRLTDALILDGQTYLICGGNSRVLRTTTGGAVWSDHTFETAATTRFEALASFPSTEVVMMVGMERSFRSEDGGVTWTPVNLRARDVVAVSADVAVAVGDEILRSVDRGRTWAIVGGIPEAVADFKAPIRDLRAVAFAEPRHGIAVGGLGLMMESLDGGASWEVVPRATSRELATIVLGPGAMALAGGRDGVLLEGRP